MSSAPLLRPRAAAILALLFCAFAALTSSFWEGTRDAFANAGGDYAVLRTERAFFGLPVAPIARRLDEILPRDVPVALAPDLAEDDGARQRLTEGLYPRRVDATAPRVLSLNDDGTVRTPEPDPAIRPATALPPIERCDFDLLGLLVSLGALLGFGFAVVSLIPSLRNELPVVVLAGSAVVGAAVYGSTFLQAGAPWWLYRAAGLACLPVAAMQAKPWRDAKRRLASLGRAPEIWILVALIALLFARMAWLPIAGWDGRSVWLFHAKQIYFQKMMALADLHHPDWDWSHPVYPFLMPGVMALFGGGGGAFNERTAALALPIVWGSSLAVVWGLLREHAGRAVATALVATLFFGMQMGVGELYMDGLVATLLAIFALSVASPERRAIAVLAAFVVSLVKIEGAIAAGLVMAAWTAYEVQRGGRRLATAALLLPLVLPLAHWGWRRANDITDSQSRGSSVAAAPDRLPTLIAGVPQLLARETIGQQTETQALMRLAVVGLALGLATLALRRPRSPLFLPALGAGLLFAALAIGETSGMPQDAAWLVSWTLDRLLLHPALLFVLLPFL